MKKLIFLLGITVTALGQKSIGEKSPEIFFKKIVNYEKPGAKLSHFKDKVVLLDFWATWCGPCISAFPKLEGLQHKFGDQLQVITVTDDPEARIERFLDKRKLTLPVVLDEDRTIADIFPHRSIPHLVIIDRKGIVRAITTSSEITEEIVQKVINDEPVSLREKKDIMDFDPDKLLSGDGDFSYQVTFTRFKEGYPGFSNSRGTGPYTGRRIVGVNLSPVTLFEIAWQFPPAIRTLINVKEPARLKWSKQNAVCFDLIVPEDLGEKRFEIMKNQLSIYFPYTVKTEEKTRKVKILSGLSRDIPLRKSLPGTKTEYSESGKGMSMKASSIDWVSEFLQNRLGIPVVDETGLTGKYDLDLPWFNESPEQIHEELKKIGLRLSDGERKIKMLVITD